MTTRPDYLRYLESATQAEYEERLRSEGYSVQAEGCHGDVQFDLIARNGAKTIAYEFRAGGNRGEMRDRLVLLQRAAKEAGFEFHIVAITPPPRVKIEIDDFNRRLFHYMANEGLPIELKTLSDHTKITRIHDVRIADIHVGNGEIRLAGLGSVQVELQDRIEPETLDISEDAFPFRFKAVLSADGQLKAVEELVVDTSTFYE
jgi:hypothetical protein